MKKNIPINSYALSQKMVRLLVRGDKEIRQGWHRELNRKLGGEAFEKWKEIEKAGDGADLLSLFLTLLKSDRAVTSEDIVGLLRKLRLQAYFLSDLFAEITCLETVIVDYLRDLYEFEKPKLLYTVLLIHRRSSELLDKVIRETAEIYEYVIENGPKGFCQLDNEGRIIAHNKQMEKFLGGPDIEGKRLEKFFKNDDEKEFIRNVVQGGLGKEPAMRKLYLKARDSEDHIPIGTEISQIMIGGRSRGSYACMTDITQAEREMLQIFDRSTLGIVITSLSGIITYANKEFLNIVGIQEWKGKTIQKILGEGEAWSEVEKGLERRKRGLSDEYKVAITKRDGKKIPVLISAAPQTDLNGRTIGSWAIIRNMELEETVNAVNKHIEEVREWKILLDKVAQEIQKVVPYSLCIFTRYSDDGMHSRELTHYPQIRELEWSRRWWEITEPMRAFLNQKIPVFDNIDEYLSREEWKDLKEDLEFKRLLETGVKSFLYIPVLKGGNVVASITLLSTSKGVFKSGDKKALRALPLDAAVNMTIYYQEREELIFRLCLLNDLSSVSNNIESIAELIVKKIGAHYEWDNVSLFRVDEEKDVVVLEKEFASSESFSLGPAFEQQIGKGVLGRVKESGELICIPDVDREEFKNVCIKALKQTKSELCLPINISGHVRWLLNIEDSHQNAFSEENKTAMREIARELTGILKRARTQHFLRETLKNASDGILTTDGKGRVAKANPAWSKLLGYPPDVLKGRAVVDFFSDKRMARNLLASDSVPNRKILLRHSEGDTVEVLLSISKLPKKLTGKILIAKDLALAKRTEELEYLEKMYYEIATQTKTPLSLVFTWLNRLKEETGYSGDTIDKIIKQLRRVDLTFDRLAMYNRKGESAFARHILLDIREVMNKTLEDIPKGDREQIFKETVEPLPLLRGDLYQLFFCFQTILSYLLRFLPQEKNIHWRIWQKNGMIVSEISGYFPAPADKRPDDLERAYSVSKTLTEIATGKALVKSFIEEHGGQFLDPTIKGDCLKFRIELPAAEREER